MDDGGFADWWLSEAAFDAPEAVQQGTMAEVARLARLAWNAATERAAKVAGEYAASRKRLDEQWTAEEVAARIRGGA